MTEELKQQLINKINSFNIKPCAVCGNNNFNIGGDCVALPTMNVENKSIQVNKFFPCAIVICTKCGNINFHSLGTIGFLEPETKEEIKNG